MCPSTVNKRSLPTSFPLSNLKIREKKVGVVKCENRPRWAQCCYYYVIGATLMIIALEVGVGTVLWITAAEEGQPAVRVRTVSCENDNGNNYYTGWNSWLILILVVSTDTKNCAFLRTTWLGLKKNNEKQQ